MFYVYLLQSIADPKQRYIGFTNDLKKRLAAHNNGESSHTRKFAPWSPTKRSLTNSKLSILKST
jgi:putative endonuclease